MVASKPRLSGMEALRAALTETPVEAPSKRQRLHNANVRTTPRSVMTAANVRTTPRSGMKAEPVVTMPQAVDISQDDGISRQDMSQPGMTYVRPSRMRKSGVWDVASYVRVLERRAEEARHLAEPIAQTSETKGSKTRDSKQNSAHRLDVDSTSKSSKSPNLVSVAKAAKMEADANVQALTRRKGALVIAQEEYLKPLLALEEQDEQAEELVPSLLTALADSDLGIGGGGRGQLMHLAQLLAQVLEWDAKCRAPSEKKLWQHLQDALSKCEVEVEDKLLQAETQAATLSAELEKAHAEVRASTAKVRVARKASTVSAKESCKAVKARASGKQCDEEVVSVLALKTER